MRQDTALKVNILLIIKNFDIGGAESHVCTLANQLSENGHKVFVISRSGRQIRSLEPSVKRISILLSDFLFLWNLVKIAKTILREEIDVIHSHQRLSIALGSLAGKLTGVPHIATVHGRIKKDLRSTFIKRLTDKVIVTNENSMKGAKSHKILNSKTIFIFNGVNVNKSYSKPLKPIILFASRIDKRHAILMKSIMTDVWPYLASKYPDLKIKICGDGPYFKMIKKLCKEHCSNEFHNSLCFMGFQEAYCNEFRNVSLVVGAGRTAIEAITSGIPVLSLHTKHIGDLITTENYESYKYGNFVAIDGEKPTAIKLIDNITKYLNNQHYYHKEAELLKSNAIKDFDIRTITDQITSVYNNMISGVDA